MHALATINTHRVKATFRDKVFVLDYVKITPMRWPIELAHCMTQREETVAEINAAEDGDAELLEFEKARDEPMNPEEDKDREMVKANRGLKKKVGARAVDYVARLHKNLGHPSPEVLVKMLTEVQATENVLQAAREYVCRNCYHRENHFKYHPLEESLQLLLAIAWWWTLHGFSWRQDVNVSSLCVMKQLATLPSASCRARSPLSLSRAWSALGCVTLDCPSTCE